MIWRFEPYAAICIFLVNNVSFATRMTDGLTGFLPVKHFLRKNRLFLQTSYQIRVARQQCRIKKRMVYCEIYFSLGKNKFHAIFNSLVLFFFSSSSSKM